MAAIDTNVLVRFFAQDDPAQFRRAVHLIETSDVWVSLTVMLETEWVLRKVMGIQPRPAVALLRAFAGLENVTVENHSRLSRSFDLAEAGMDFADALHLTAVKSGEKFATFDQDLIRAAKRSGIEAVFAP